jgi:hypothetical protein
MASKIESFSKGCSTKAILHSTNESWKVRARDVGIDLAMAAAFTVVWGMVYWSIPQINQSLPCLRNVNAQHWFFTGDARVCNEEKVK